MKSTGDKEGRLQESAEPLATLREALIAIAKHRGKVLLTALATVGTVALVAWLWPPTYEAHSSLLIKFGREYVYITEVGEARGESKFFSKKGIIKTELEILNSRDLAEELVDTIGQDVLYPALVRSDRAPAVVKDKIIREFRKRLFVKGAEESDVIHVSFHHPDPEIVARVVNTMVELFKDKHLETFSNARAAAFLEQKVEGYQERLQMMEKKLETFKQEYRAFSIEEQRTLLLRQRSSLDADLKTAVNRLAELERKLKGMQEQIAALPAVSSIFADRGGPLPVTAEAKARLLNLKVKEQELLSKYTENNSQVQDVRRQITLVEDFIIENEEHEPTRERTGKSEVYLDLERSIMRTETDVSALGAKRDVLLGQVSQMDEELQDLTAREKELRHWERERVAAEENYRTYSMRLEATRISREMDLEKLTNVSVIESAAVPSKPLGLRKLYKLAIAAVLGLATGIGVAFLAEFLTQGMSTPEAARRRLDLPVLSTVSYKAQG